MLFTNKATGKKNAHQVYFDAKSKKITERGEALIELIKAADGEKANPLYWASKDGLIDQKGESLVELITTITAGGGYDRPVKALIAQIKKENK